MASLALGVIGAGAAHAGVTAGLLSATYLGMATEGLGWMIGSSLGSMLGGGSSTVNYGPRLGDLKVQSSAYGKPIPRIYGRYRIAGNMIWSKPIKETVHKKKMKSGGKGGGKQKATQITYTYSQSFAIAICEGPVVSIRKIWANGELIYNMGFDATPETRQASQKLAQQMSIYLGTEDQVPNSLIEADIGVNNTPAYRGTVYVVFDDIQLEQYGNRTPSLEFEIVTIADVPKWTRYDDGFHLPISGIDCLTNDGNRFVGLKTFFQALTEPPYFIQGTYLATSFDGMTWQFDEVTGDLSSSFIGMHSIIKANNSRLIAAANAGNIFISDDEGASWLQTSTLGPDFLCSRGPEDLCVGLISGDTPTNRFVYSTNNGSSWNSSGFNFTGRAASAVSGGPSIATDGYIFIAVGTSAGDVPYIAKSSDGMAWTEAILDPLQSTPGTYFIAYGNGVWIIGNSNGEIYRSEDGGSTWLKLPTVLPFPVYATICYGNGKFLIAAMAGYSYMTEDNGDNWVAIEIEGDLRNQQLTFGKDHFVATFSTYMTSEEPYTEIAGAVWLLPAALGKSIILKDVVEAECALVGVSGNKVDASELIDPIIGYAITNRASIRSSIEPLCGAFSFDGVEVDGKVKFIKRGGLIAASIPEDDMGAYMWGSAAPDTSILERTQDVELPDEVTLNYADSDAAYEIGAQYSRRLIGSSNSQMTVSMPLATNAKQAKHIADVLMYAAWQGRGTIQFSTSVKYSYLVPTDVVTVVKNGIVYTLRIVSKNEQGTLINFTAVGEDLQVYNQNAPAPSLPQPVQDVDLEKRTILRLLDIPLLLDFDPVPSFYSAVVSMPGVGSWDGAQIFDSVDDVDYRMFGQAHDIEAIIGEATTVLPEFTANIFDEGNTVTIKLIGGELFSDTEQNVLNGANAAVLGDEIIQFKTATLISAGEYELSGLLRGRRGTEWATKTHAIGDRFVLLEEDTVLPQLFSIGNLNKTRYYKAITAWNAVDDEPDSELFTWRAVVLKPYAPVNLGGGRDGSGNLLIKWVRRTRISGEWIDYSDVPLGEESELYDVEIWDSGFTELKRTFAGLTTAEVTYSEADQITDFGSVQGTVYCRIYQISSVVGRGYALEGSI